ncbi:immunity 22 family protein [Pseudomonas sp. SWRI111]|uniref:immunity 22 family protein n=1 Tax=Pseudomonas sp. SWRI111 TaxID=2745507 RepID=UPI0016464205|nr:immunity 22 family protein [Pseudomonas sp. SWRI111]MBC3210405.1 immunity 22 family protein [Pseudomonas sp. SWRI111]
MKRKTVSIWTANSDWQPTVLREIMTPVYSEDGASLGSEFTNAFSLGFIDDDVIEADIVEPTNLLEEAIQGFSYDSDIASDIKRKNTPTTPSLFNTVIAIYDFTYKGTPKTRTLREIEITYRGHFEYQE